jgi:formylglycine-generating enzyme required for sulfatase activity/outer membrane protein assembly factor BamB
MTRTALTLACAALLAAAAAATRPAEARREADEVKILKRFADEFVELTPGKGKFPASFKMGSAAGPASEKPVVTVRLARPFAAARYEVTQELYQLVAGANPSRWKGPRNSVEVVNWDEANAFCARATDLLRKHKLLGADEVIRLPSEAEWEYACRAGAGTAYSFGDKVEELGAHAWFKGNSKGEDPPVGRKKPNAWGLYDMHGYVWEWCADAWNPDHTGAAADGRPRVKAGEKERVIRGGSWDDEAERCRCAARDHKAVTFRSDKVGFRCVRAARDNPAVKETAAEPASDWPQFLGPTRNAASAERGLIGGWPKAGPEVLWEHKAGEGYSSPVVAAGSLLLFHRVGNEEVLDCLDAATGKERWKFSYRTSYADDYGKGNGPRSTPLVAGGRVYTLGPGGVLSCVALKDGSKLWQRPLHDDYDVRKGFFGVGTSPLLEGDNLLVNVGGKGAGIVAFHKETGKEVWKATEHEASYSSPIAATVDGVRHAFFFTREGLVSLDPVSGKVRFSKRWRSRINASVNAATPVLLGGDHLFLSACYGTGAVLLRVKKDAVEEVWKSDEVLSCHFATPVAVGRYLFGFEGRQEEGARLRCVEWKTGKVMWTEAGFGSGSLIAAGERLFILSEDGRLMLAEANGARYQELARGKVLGKPCRAHLALADGRLYARDGSKLVCWKIKK